MRSLILVLVLATSALPSSVSAQFVRRGYYYPQQPAQQKPVSRLDQKVDGHIDYNSGDVADMPQGADKLYMTLVTSDDWQTDTGPRGQAQRKLRTWLENDKRLIGYRSNARFNWLTESDPGFVGARTLANGNASSLKARLGIAFPILAIEDASGEAHFKMSAMSMPNSSGELADWITSSLKAKSVPVPKFSGQSEATPIITEGLRSDCGPDGCPVQPSPPHQDSSEVLDDTPRYPVYGDYSGLAVLGAFGAAAAGLFGVATRRPGIKTRR